jgi:hypothetical protein
MAKAVRSVEAEGLPSHCSSSLFGHLLYPRREQVLRRRLCFLLLLSRLGQSRLDPSLGAVAQLPAPSGSSGFKAAGSGATRGCSGDAGRSTTRMA